MPSEAELRGLDIHWVRFACRNRHDPHISRKGFRMMVRQSVTALRDMGPGPVVLPETAAGPPLGPPMDWWGPREEAAE